MAERYLIASGNVSDPANWFGGNKPTVGDTAHANGFTGTIDEDISADTWTTAAGSSAAAGGGFTLLDGFTLTGNVEAGTTSCVTYSGSGESVIDGDIKGSDTNAVRGLVIPSGTTGRLDITGDLIASLAVGSRAVEFVGAVGSRVIVHGSLIRNTDRQIWWTTANCTGGSVEIRGSIEDNNSTSTIALMELRHSLESVEIWGSVIANNGRVFSLSHSAATEPTNRCNISVYGSVVVSGNGAGFVLTSTSGAKYGKLRIAGKGPNMSIDVKGAPRRPRHPQPVHRYGPSRRPSHHQSLRCPRYFQPRQRRGSNRLR
jgi:hypothetical protein